MATPEELETLANSLLADIEQLGQGVRGLESDIEAAQDAIQQAGEILNAEISQYESDCEGMLTEAQNSLDAMFEMVQALSGESAEAYAAEIAAMIGQLEAARGEVAQVMRSAAAMVDEKLGEAQQSAEDLRGVITAVTSEGEALAERSNQTLAAMREAVDSGVDAAVQRMGDAKIALEEVMDSVTERQGELNEFVSSDLVSDIDNSMQELSDGVRQTTSQLVVGGIEATRDAALDTLESGVKSVVDEAVAELLRLMDELSDEILEKADGPREKTDAMREVVETLRGLIDPLVDRIGSVRGLAASVGVSV